ncbi:hypothetical protein [endosymbiont GvMRE of Glomus versiforme]|nr:hypothetical protein [endosymbiont GvMRE of Glomus versiforme]RHZ36332.1 hypothetical protein GvMRE_Ic1g136 [endosymbiont GvMRE of Glomus versiforme]
MDALTKIKQVKKENLRQFLRKVRRVFKPQHWKWAVIAELQKNGHWHKT